VNGLIEEVGLKKVAAVAEVMRFTRGFPPDRLRRPAGVQKVEVARARGVPARAQQKPRIAQVGLVSIGADPTDPVLFLRYEPGMPCVRGVANAQHKRKIRP
jgi:hypothetical protein